MNDVVLDKTIFDKAVQLLAQRDYSESQLSKKLFLFFSQKNPQQDCENLIETINSIISRCRENNWLDDLQYIKNYFAMRTRKGFGKNRIVQELKQKGLERDKIDTVLQQLDIDWINIARYQMDKKFKQINKHDLKQKKQIYQFLLYRGFSQTDVNSLYQTVV